MTAGEKYGPAMQITDQDEADRYFGLLVSHTMAVGKTRQEAESIERENLGYWAGYYDYETRIRVEKLFRCAHPIFGAIADNGPPTSEEAFRAGFERGLKTRQGFTLTELLVVIVIILAVSVIALPGVVNAIASRQVDASAQLLQGAIVGARDNAIRTNQLAGLRFIPNPANPNELVEIAPLQSAPDYTEGLANTYPAEAYPASVTGGLPCLVLEESPGSWHLAGGKYGWLPNSPTGWAWNIRVGDRVYLAGHTFTVCGPVPTANAEFLVSGNTLSRTYTSPDGSVSIALNPEYLLLVNGLDDNGDGFIDNGWDGIDNDRANGVDDVGEWEIETWAGMTQQTSISYRIVRRPVRGKGQTVDLSAPINLAQSNLPQNAVDGSVEVLIRPDGSAALTSFYATPAQLPVFRNGKVAPPALSFVVGTPSDHRTVTLWPKTGLIESGD